MKHLIRTLSRISLLGIGGSSIAIVLGIRYLELGDKSKGKVAKELFAQLTRFTETLRTAEKTELCDDCDDFGHGYMLKCDVWGKACDAAPDKETRFLCLPCCEKRLGRPVVLDDLNRDMVINGPLLYAWGAEEETSDSDYDGAPAALNINAGP